MKNLSWMLQLWLTFKFSSFFCFFLCYRNTTFSFYFLSLTRFLSIFLYFVENLKCSTRNLYLRLINSNIRIRENPGEYQSTCLIQLSSIRHFFFSLVFQFTCKVMSWSKETMRNSFYVLFFCFFILFRRCEKRNEKYSFFYKGILCVFFFFWNLQSHPRPKALFVLNIFFLFFSLLVKKRVFFYWR